MRKRFLLASILCLCILSSCTHEELQVDKRIQFSFTNVSNGTNGGAGGASGGRTNGANATSDPQSVMVTIKDDAGNTVVSQQTLTLYKFGDSFLSSPLTLQASSTGNYHLSDFFVMSSDNQVTYATPREGSALAYLVADPLDILFTVDANTITTITPEVLAVSGNSDATDYGYAQFGFNVIKTINAVFSSFIKGTSNFELTSAHLKIEGLPDNTSDAAALWVYETDIAAKANTILLKEAVSYKITATKDGYEPWIRTMTLQSNETIEILFEKGNEVDVYMAGVINIVGVNHFAAYWKNGVQVQLSTKTSIASDIFVSDGDVYVAGSEDGTTNAFYWKNGTQVFLPQAGIIYKIFVAENDVYLLGFAKNNGSDAPAYWKNGILTELPAGSGVSIFSNLVVDGTDVYATGSQTIQGDSRPVFWKNGISTRLLPPSPYQNYSGTATGLKVEGGHVYVSGFASASSINSRVALYWKDGQSTILPNTSPYCLIMQLDVENNDVYVVGSVQSGRGCYWKNGEQFFVDAPQSGVNLYCMRILNGTTYMAGDQDFHDGTGYFPTYWVDGKPTNSKTQEGNVYGMYVDVPK